jgi:RNA polymerase sigma-70 factor (ECF subfamily)
MIRPATVCLVDGSVGLMFAPRGRLDRVLRFTMHDDKITQLEIIADPATLESLELAVLPA